MKPVILLVDDEPDLVQVLADALHASMPRYDVQVATSFEEAETALVGLGASLSLVVADHRLGGRTGLELLERLRVDQPLVPSILFTGQAHAEDEDRARAAGARVLWKPLGLNAWIGEVRAMLA